jgi:hypothetical protein
MCEDIEAAAIFVSAYLDAAAVKVNGKLFAFACGFGFRVWVFFSLDIRFLLLFE